MTALILMRRIEEAGGNLAETARRAGVNRTHLFALLHRVGLGPKRTVKPHAVPKYSEGWRAIQ